MPEVRAAGGLVWRGRRDGGPGNEVLLIHRPRYDDWSFPKGKCDDGESYRAAAEREVAEETGLKLRAEGEAFREIRYTDHKGRSKAVRYWLMAAVDDDGDLDDFEPNEEVDEVRWLPVAEAIALLTYDHDRDLLAAFDRGLYFEL